MSSSGPQAGIPQNLLTIAGLGIKDLVQMTVEARQAILDADEVLYLGTEPARHIAELLTWGARSVRSILQLYVDGDVDEHNYERLAQAVTAAASTNLKTVLLVPGHPRVGVSLVQRLSKLAPSPLPQSSLEAFQVTVLPGVSSFDTMINDLGRDPIEKGSVIMDANRALLFELTWPASMDCYFYHVCSVGTRLVHVHDARKDNSWDLLKVHLLKIYKPTTAIQLISSATRDGRESQVVAAPLSELENLLPHVHFGTTMFIAGERPSRLNQEFLNQLLQQNQNQNQIEESQI
jgi:uncharacterized protein YabN with tetrapyrrole methylase and pyrophosphatase domain